MNVIFQFVFAFFATVSFAIYFNSPIKSVVASGLIGGIAWVLYYLIFNILQDKALGILLASLLVGVLGELFAVKLKKPATIFITTGIISLVPGAGMYYTMYNLVEENFLKAAGFATETFFIAASIAIGIILSAIFSRSIKSLKKD